MCATPCTSRLAPSSSGQALLFPSAAIFIYLLVFAVTVFAFVKLYEEPTLQRTFGDEYTEYRCDSARLVSTPAAVVTRS